MVTIKKNVPESTELYFSPSGEAIWHSLKEECLIALILFYRMASAMDADSNIFLYRKDFTLAFYDEYLQEYKTGGSDFLLKTLRYLISNSIVGMSKSIENARSKTIVMPMLRDGDNDKNLTLIMLNPNLINLGRIPPFNYPTHEKLVFLDTDLETRFKENLKDKVVMKDNRVQVFSVTADPLNTTTPQTPNHTIH